MSAPWTDRLQSGSHKLLLAGVAAALATAGLSFWLARNDGRRVYPEAPAGQVARIGTSAWSLDRLQETGELPVLGGTRKPVAKATFVVARLRADLTDTAPPAGCLLHLQAGDYAFASDTSFTPSDPTAATTCEAGTNGMITAAFEVPTRLLDQVDGVRVLLGAEQLVLPGGLVG